MSNTIDNFRLYLNSVAARSIRANMSSGRDISDLLLGIVLHWLMLLRVYWLLVGIPLLLLLLLTKDVRIPLQYGAQQFRLGLWQLGCVVVLVPLVPVRCMEWMLHQQLKGIQSCNLPDVNLLCIVGGGCQGMLQLVCQGIITCGQQALSFHRNTWVEQQWSARRCWCQRARQRHLRKHCQEHLKLWKQTVNL